jgi:chemotaxis protein CheD
VHRAHALRPHHRSGRPPARADAAEPYCARAQRPATFVDTGVAALLAELLGLGASRRHLVACVAGAATLLDDDRLFDVGRRNHLVLRKMLWKNGILVAAEDVGGNCSRTLWLDTADGRTGLKRQGSVIDLHPGPSGAAAGTH